MTPRDIVQSYFDRGLRPVFWPAIGNLKGPIDDDWPNKTYTIDDYHEGMRVGIFHGVELSPGRILVDVDIDWGPGLEIALALLPSTELVWGRESKPISHCFYTIPEIVPQFVYKDIGKHGTTLIEFRPDKHQSMAPPTIWEKDGKREQLEFAANANKLPTHMGAEYLQRRVMLSAIGMLLAKHLGPNGFGHEPRLAWAGFLLRHEVTPEEMVIMGEAMSRYCNNTEVTDVQRVVNSTVNALRQDGKRVKGEPAFIRLLGDNGKAITAKIKDWLGVDSDWERAPGENGRLGRILKDRQNNIRRAIRLLGYELSYNEFSERALIKEEGKAPVVIDDFIINSIYLRIDRDFHFKPTLNFYKMVFEDIAHDNTFHPVREYLDSLTWDGVPRIAWLLQNYAGATDEAPEGHVGKTYLQAVSEIFMMAAVKRIRHPGCKFDEMVVLISTQGKDKSSGLRALAVNDEWFSDDLPLNVDSKVVIENTLGKWIVEASDLVGGRKADRDHLKSMLSRQIDGPARMAYAHLPVERARQFIIIGTTNNNEFLADIQNRRFWPVSVESFDVPAIILDRNQLWAEAAHREAQGESIRLAKELYDEANVHQEQRREIDSWEDAIADEVDGLEVTSAGRQQITADAVWKKLGIETARQDRYGQQRISSIMQRFGFKRTNIRADGKVKTGYIRQTDETQRPARYDGPADTPF